MIASTYLFRRVFCLFLVVCLMLGAVPAAVATPPVNPPQDIQSHWAYEAIRFMLAQGFMQGTSDTTFEPNLAFSRAMAVTILHRMADEPETASAPIFSDVAPGRWYSDAVAWAHSTGVVQGVGDDRFAPTVNITRQELATILYRFATVQDYDMIPPISFTPDFPDANLIDEWATEAMWWAVDSSLIRGTDLGELNPRGNATRAEAATILMRFAMRHIIPEPDPEPEQPQLPIEVGFALTISVEETTLPQGEDFRVHIELKNNNDEDYEISYHYFHWLVAHIPGWHISDEWGSVTLPPFQETRLFEAGSIIEYGPRIIGRTLESGTHELRFLASFHLNWGQDNQQRINLTSNTILLTVTESTTNPVRTITATEGRDMMQDGNHYLLIDVRTEEEFRTRRIPRAISIPGPVLTDRITAAAPYRNSRIILYCQTGRRSAAAATALAELGYRHIYDMGGITAWPYETISG